MPDRPPRLPELEDLGPLGEGGAGVVRRVRDPVLDRSLALKILRSEREADPEALARFLREARLMARLQHPGVVPVSALGRLPDGRLGLCMQEVRGRTLTDHIHEAHARGAGVRRLVEWLLRAAQAVAYAHSQGVVHRDLKPDNIMVGDFGEVVVLDWGLARVGDEVEPRDEVVGTAMYMAPEQALGEPVGPAADVYALGATLHHALAGRAPFASDDVWELIAAKLNGEVLPLPSTAPAALAALAAQAMSLAAGDRPADARAFADEIEAWLDDSRQREAALAVVAEADALLPEIARLRAAAGGRAAEARGLLASLRATDPVETRRPAWDAEDEAGALIAEAERLERARISLLHTALHRAPELPEALDALADHYRARCAQAEARGDRGAADWEALLRSTGRHRDWLDGDGTLELRSSPAGAEVSLYRWVLVGRRLEPALERRLGETPLRCAVGRGSWLLRLDAPGCDPLWLPIEVERLARWSGAPPGDEEPVELRLSRSGELSPEEALIAPGPFLAGGDPEAADVAPAARVWLPGFVLRRDPVTLGEYAAFLASIDDPLERAARTPRPIPGEQRGAVVWRERDGRPIPEGEGPLEALLRCPVTRVSWHDALAFAAWASARTGHLWRLPHELEREKAGRGADARAFPWGDFYEPTWVHALAAQTGRPSVAPVGSSPGDRSLYGVRGLAGNVSDWCANPWRRDGPPIEGGMLRFDDAPAEFYAVRGGHYRASARLCRLASRTAARPDEVFSTLGFRLARSWP